MIPLKKMSEEQFKEAVEILQKLGTELDEIESYLEQLAVIGCDNYNLGLIVTISDVVDHLKTVKENLEFYKCPTAWP